MKKKGPIKVRVRGAEWTLWGINERVSMKRTQDKWEKVVQPARKPILAEYREDKQLSCRPAATEASWATKAFP